MPARLPGHADVSGGSRGRCGTGLGMVKETFAEAVHHGPPCSENSVKFLGFPARWVVPNKGEIHFALAPSPKCWTFGPSVAFTVTGGTGIYAGASGSGTFSEVARLGNDGTWRGVHTWTGPLSVPGLDFDVTAPVLTGATNKTVKARKGAKRVRVTYSVTARDAVDDAVVASCAPRSGSLFKVGRTSVTCSASDKSANTGTARFRITVRPAR